MTTYASWKGLIARLDCDTNDGRRLVAASFAGAHFVRMPVPVFVMPKPVHLSSPLQATSTGPGEVCGRIDRVSVRRPDDTELMTKAPEGLEVYAEGMVTLEDVLRVRPDLAPPNVISQIDAPPSELWPVGITVIGGDFEGDPNAGAVSMAGAWELTGLTIEHQPSVWPGVGIMLTDFEMGA